MSYGNVYIKSDIKQLKQEGYLSRDDIIEKIAERINARYRDISMDRARRIATRGYNSRGYE